MDDSTVTVEAQQDAGRGFLREPAIDADIRRMFDEDLEEDGFVMNLTRLWAHAPVAYDRFRAMLGEATRAGDLDLRRRAVLVTATASTIGDPYCSTAWGRRLAATAGEVAAVSVLHGGDEGLTAQGRELARWARLIAEEPAAATADDVERLRRAGLDDRRIFAVTLYIAGRLAFSTVNSALGARPDEALEELAPPRVLEAVRARGRGPRRARR